MTHNPLRKLHGLNEFLCLHFLHIRNEDHDKCPICQTKLHDMNDSWVLPELPKTNEVNEEILTELNALTNESDGNGGDSN